MISERPSDSMHMQIMCLCLASRVSLGRWQPPINSQSLSGPPCHPHLLVADSRASRMSACTCSSTLHMQKLRIAVDTAYSEGSSQSLLRVTPYVLRGPILIATTSLSLQFHAFAHTCAPCIRFPSTYMTCTRPHM